MKEIDINQLISAYYDNELTESELDLLLEETKRDPGLLAKLNNYALISAVSEKDEKVVSIFKNISDFVIDIIFQTYNPQIFIEGYSFGSKGQGLFQIAENCGILKYRLQEENLPYSIVVPSVVKKGATGKGNADKDMMYEAFVKETKIDLKKLFDTEKVGNPISDIVDSYFIQKVGNDNLLCSW